MPTLLDRFKNGWNAFIGRDPTKLGYQDYGYSSSFRPDRSSSMFISGDQSIIRAICCKIAIDVAAVTIEHVKIDKETGYQDLIDDSLNECLNLSANIDQTGRSFIQDIVMSMCDEGVVAVVPTDLDIPSNITQNPEDTESFNVLTMRTGKIVQWYPQHVRVRVYNERTGRQEEIVVGKAYTAIIENPLYAIMNEPNSTFQRLKKTLNDIDALNAQYASGKLDLIIQLPYTIKSDQRQQQADHRKKLIEEQLHNSKYGIAYLDATEKIVQLNRPLDNSLWQQANDLKQEVFNQLGLTKEVFDGTANEAAMINYTNRTVEPFVSAIIDEYKRKFISRNARSRGETIIYYKDPFRLVPASQLATIADTFTRNEILTPNEIRTELGYKPSKDPKADELRNRNINQSDVQLQNQQQIPTEPMAEEEQQVEAATAPEEEKLTAEEIMEMIDGA